MQIIREWWNALRNFMIVVSFITNLILIVVLGVVVHELFTIKHEVAEPLIYGLHSNFVGLSEAEIVAQVPVEDDIQVTFDLPLSQETNVILTEDVRIANMPATFTTGPGSALQGTVSIILPTGTRLPVSLDMIVPVDQSVPIKLNVPVHIPLSETELAQPFANLQGLFAPLVNGLDNLPNEWNEVPDFSVDTVQGEYTGEDNLLRDSPERQNAWSCVDTWGRPCAADVTDVAGGDAQEATPSTNTDAPVQTSPATPTVPPPPANNDNQGPAPTPTFTPFPN